MGTLIRRRGSLIRSSARMKGDLGLTIGTGTLQTDLRVETVHLRRFYNNFASVRSAVTPPLPVPGMDTEAVLVETYEAGKCHPLNKSNQRGFNLCRSQGHRHCLQPGRSWKTLQASARSVACV